MKHHRVRRYTVLLSRPGQASNVYSFSPWLIGLLVGVLLFWTAAGAYLFIEHRRGETAGVRLAALSTQARQLSLQLESQKTRNNRLSRQAISLMNQLDKLEGEINSLRKRAGLPQVKPAPTLGKVPQGGGVPLDVQGLLGTTDARLAVLVRDLNRNVAPALNNRLAREGARPVGYPIDTTTYIASGFGVRRNPFGSGYESHSGDDLPAAYTVRRSTPLRQDGWCSLAGDRFSDTMLSSTMVTGTGPCMGICRVWPSRWASGWAAGK